MPSSALSQGSGHGSGNSTFIYKQQPSSNAGSSIYPASNLSKGYQISNQTHDTQSTTASGIDSQIHQSTEALIKGKNQKIFIQNSNADSSSQIGKQSKLMLTLQGNNQRQLKKSGASNNGKGLVTVSQSGRNPSPPRLQQQNSKGKHQKIHAEQTVSQSTSNNSKTKSQGEKLPLELYGNSKNQKGNLNSHSQSVTTSLIQNTQQKSFHAVEQSLAQSHNLLSQPSNHIPQGLGQGQSNHSKFNFKASQSSGPIQQPCIMTMSRGFDNPNKSKKTKFIQKAQNVQPCFLQSKENENKQNMNGTIHSAQQEIEASLNFETHRTRAQDIQSHLGGSSNQKTSQDKRNFLTNSNQSNTKITPYFTKSINKLKNIIDTQQTVQATALQSHQVSEFESQNFDQNLPDRNKSSLIKKQSQPQVDRQSDKSCYAHQKQSIEELKGQLSHRNLNFNQDFQKPDDNGFKTTPSIDREMVDQIKQDLIKQYERFEQLHEKGLINSETSQQVFTYLSPEVKINAFNFQDQINIHTQQDKIPIVAITQHRGKSISQRLSQISHHVRNNQQVFIEEDADMTSSQQKTNRKQQFLNFLKSSGLSDQSPEGTAKRQSTHPDHNFKDEFFQNEGTPRVHRTLDSCLEQEFCEDGAQVLYECEIPQQEIVQSVCIERKTDIKSHIDQQNAINELGSFAFNPALKQRREEEIISSDKKTSAQPVKQIEKNNTQKPLRDNFIKQPCLSILSPSSPDYTSQVKKNDYFLSQYTKSNGGGVPRSKPVEEMRKFDITNIESAQSQICSPISMNLSVERTSIPPAGLNSYNTVVNHDLSQTNISNSQMLQNAQSSNQSMNHKIKNQPFIFVQNKAAMIQQSYQIYGNGQRKFRKISHLNDPHFNQEQDSDTNSFNRSTPSSSSNGSFTNTESSMALSKDQFPILVNQKVSDIEHQSLSNQDQIEDENIEISSMPSSAQTSTFKSQNTLDQNLQNLNELVQETRSSQITKTLCTQTSLEAASNKVNYETEIGIYQSRNANNAIKKERNALQQQNFQIQDGLNGNGFQFQTFSEHPTIQLQGGNNFDLDYSNTIQGAPVTLVRQESNSGFSYGTNLNLLHYSNKDSQSLNNLKGYDQSKATPAFKKTNRHAQNQQLTSNAASNTISSNHWRYSNASDQVKDFQDNQLQNQFGGLQLSSNQKINDSHQFNLASHFRNPSSQSQCQMNQLQNSVASSLVKYNPGLPPTSNSKMQKRRARKTIENNIQANELGIEEIKCELQDQIVGNQESPSGFMNDGNSLLLETSENIETERIQIPKSRQLIKKQPSSSDSMSILNQKTKEAKSKNDQQPLLQQDKPKKQNKIRQKSKVIVQQDAVKKNVYRLICVSQEKKVKKKYKATDESNPIEFYNNRLSTQPIINKQGKFPIEREQVEEQKEQRQISLTKDHINVSYLSQIPHSNNIKQSSQPGMQNHMYRSTKRMTTHNFSSHKSNQENSNYGAMGNENMNSILITKNHQSKPSHLSIPLYQPFESNPTMIRKDSSSCSYCSECEKEEEEDLLNSRLSSSQSIILQRTTHSNMQSQQAFIQTMFSNGLNTRDNSQPGSNHRGSLQRKTHHISLERLSENQINEGVIYNSNGYGQPKQFQKNFNQDQFYPNKRREGAIQINPNMGSTNFTSTQKRLLTQPEQSRRYNQQIHQNQMLNQSRQQSRQMSANSENLSAQPPKSKNIMFSTHNNLQNFISQSHQSQNPLCIQNIQNQTSDLNFQRNPQIIFQNQHHQGLMHDQQFYNQGYLQNQQFMRGPQYQAQSLQSSLVNQQLKQYELSNQLGLSRQQKSHLYSSFQFGKQSLQHHPNQMNNFVFQNPGIGYSQTHSDHQFLQGQESNITVSRQTSGERQQLGQFRSQIHSNVPGNYTQDTTSHQSRDNSWSTFNQLDNSRFLTRSMNQQQFSTFGERLRQSTQLKNHILLNQIDEGNNPDSSVDLIPKPYYEQRSHHDFVQRSNCNQIQYPDSRTQYLQSVKQKRAPQGGVKNHNERSQNNQSKNTIAVSSNQVFNLEFEPCKPGVVRSRKQSRTPNEVQSSGKVVPQNNNQKPLHKARIAGQRVRAEKPESVFENQENLSELSNQVKARSDYNKNAASQKNCMIF